MVIYEDYLEKPIGVKDIPEGINGLVMIFSPLEQDMINDWNNDEMINRLVDQERIYLSQIKYDECN